MQERTWNINIPQKLTSRMPKDLILNQTHLTELVAWNTKIITFCPRISGNLEFRTKSLPSFESSLSNSLKKPFPTIPDATHGSLNTTEVYIGPSHHLK